MQFSSVLCMTLCVALTPQLSATICDYPPPCAVVRPDSILFVATVLDAGVGDSARDVRLRVEEIFAGLPPDSKNVHLRIDGPVLFKGHTYLVDAYRSNEFGLQLRTCGRTGTVDDASIASVLAYLRRRAQGKEATTLTVNVRDLSRPVPNALVTVTGPDGDIVRRTGTDGTAVFGLIKPASYKIAGTHDHYRADYGSHLNRRYQVVAGTCTTAEVTLRSENTVSGVVRDSAGHSVAGLRLELIDVPVDAGRETHFGDVRSVSGTNDQGAFAFDSVSPGRYYLGTNLTAGRSTVPRTFYPGQRSQEGALPIEVQAGEDVENLVFQLPDFGHKREVQIFVVDTKGRPAASARIEVSGPISPESVLLEGDRRTDETGCVMLHSYAEIEYRVVAMRFSGPEREFSSTLIIPPGSGPVKQVLALSEPLGFLKPR